MPSRNEIIAEAIRALADDQDEQRTLLLDIRRILVDLADAQSEHRAHTRDAIDRLGTRQLSAEHRLHALERLVPGAAE